MALMMKRWIYKHLSYELCMSKVMTFTIWFPWRLSSIAAVYLTSGAVIKVIFAFTIRIASAIIYAFAKYYI